MEKYLKAILIERDISLLRTHSIQELAKSLSDNGIKPSISEDDIDLMDTIYIPSKYPVYSALPHAMPNRSICNEALQIARETKDFILNILATD